MSIEQYKESVQRAYYKMTETIAEAHATFQREFTEATESLLGDTEPKEDTVRRDR